MFIESGALSPSVSVLLLPFFFAISHVHYIFAEQRAQKKRGKELEEDVEDETLAEELISFRKALIIAAFKLCYTQVFGIYSGYVYVNSGSLWPAIALHSHCNYFGFPSFGNLFSNNIPRTERIFISILYIAGVFIVFGYFSFFTVPGEGETGPWWQQEETTKI